MKPISELSQILRSQLPMDKRKLDCAAQVIIAMIALRTVNLTSLAKQLSGKAQLFSRYRRIQRLLREWPPTIDWIGP